MPGKACSRRLQFRGVSHSGAAHSRASLRAVHAWLWARLCSSDRPRPAAPSLPPSAPAACPPFPVAERCLSPPPPPQATRA